MSRLAFRRKPRIDAINPANAGKGMGKQEFRDRIVAMYQEAFAARDSEANFTEHRTRTLDELSDAKDEILQNPPDILLSFGGDGSNQHLLGSDDTFLEQLLQLRNQPSFIFCGGGSTDAVVGALKVKPGRDPYKAHAAIIKKIKRGVPLDPIHRHMLKINEYRGFIYGSGIVARFLHEYNAKTPKGKRRAVIVVLGALGNQLLRYLPPWRRESYARRLQVAWECYSDDKLITSGSGSRTGIVAATVEEVGMGCQLTNRAMEEVEHFHAVLSGLSFLGTCLNVPGMFWGHKLKGDVVDEVVTRLVLDYEKPTSHIIDGETYGPDKLGTRVVIERGPLLKIIRS
jgi:hypothetical protein